MTDKQKRAYVLAKCKYLYLRNASSLIHAAERKLQDRPWILTDPHLNELTKTTMNLGRDLYQASEAAEAEMRQAIGMSETEEEDIAQAIFDTIPDEISQIVGGNRKPERR